MYGEEGSLNPRTKLASAKLEAEYLVLSKWNDAVILRLPLVYGDGDTSSLMPYAVSAFTVTLMPKLRLVLDRGKPLNVCHVKDVVRAIWFARDLPPNTIVDVVDNSYMTEGMLGDRLNALFCGRVRIFDLSLFSVTMTEMMHADLMDSMLKAWSTHMHQFNVINTPLSPYRAKDTMVAKQWFIGRNNNIEKYGFVYKLPQMHNSDVVGMMRYFEEQGLIISNTNFDYFIHWNQIDQKVKDRMPYIFLALRKQFGKDIARNICKIIWRERLDSIC